MAQNTYVQRAVSLTGAARRALKRDCEPEAFTRAQACRLIALTADQELIERFKSHGNSHVKRYAAHKLEMLNLPDAGPLVEKAAWDETDRHLVARLVKASGMAGAAWARKHGVSARRVQDAVKRAS